MNKLLFLLLFSFISLSVIGQTASISGVITDKASGESLIGATVIYAVGQGTVADIDGGYQLELPFGEYEFTVQYTGYDKLVKTISVDNKVMEINFALESPKLSEVVVIADIAIEKETPVAFTNVTPKQITQELGSSDLPLLLNTAPGVYVSPTGGSDGGARVSIRGFQGRNITVMIDGIPINNMDRGNVFWSSTFGIDGILSNMQVQKGMTSSRLAIPAIGGTINFITKSISNEPSVVLKQDYGTFNTQRTSLSYNSGRLKNGWGIAAAGSFRKTDGYADEQFKEEYFYFLKVQKELGKHILSFTGMGSPVKYGIRQDKQKIAVYDKEYAAGLFDGSDDLYRRLSAYNVANNKGRESNNYDERDALAAEYGWIIRDENGDPVLDDDGNFIVDKDIYFDIAADRDFIDTAGVESKGYRYNNHWGYLNGGVLNEREREYHKPVFSLRDFWAVSDKLYWSNVLYYSYGKGGGTSRVPSLGFGDYDDNLQVDFNDDYRNNTVGGIFGPPIFPDISPNELKSGVILNKSFDNHSWWGWLSTVDYTINENFKFAGGLDFRTYKSEQYLEVHNLLGGDYFVPSNEDLPEDRPNTPQGKIFRQGDKYNYYNDNLMRWGAFFTELKYNKNQWRAFINISGVITGYKRKDYFANRDFEADGERYANAVGYGDVLFYNGSEVLVAAGAPNGATASFTQSGDTTFVTNPANNLNGYAPTGEHQIIGARRVDYEDSEVSVSETPWKNISGFSVKGGASYSINEFHGVFMNIGYISRTPRFQNVIENGAFNRFLLNIENENISSIELGYTYKSSRFAANVNGYYTDWQNRPINSGQSVFLPDRGISVRTNLNDMSAVHMGVEFNVNYLINKKLSAEVFASFGDWRWTSAKSVNFFDDQGRPIYYADSNGNITDSLLTIEFDADGVYVGDAPQTQIGASLNYKFIKNAYVKGRFTYFAKHFSNFDPLQLQFEKKGRQSWQMPSYALVSLFAGYRFEFDNFDLDIIGIVDNVFDVRYIADGQNNDGPALVTTDYLNNPPQATVAFDANSTSVYFGLPRTFSISAKFTL